MSWSSIALHDMVVSTATYGRQPVSDLYQMPWSDFLVLATAMQRNAEARERAMKEASNSRKRP